MPGSTTPSGRCVVVGFGGAEDADLTRFMPSSGRFGGPRRQPRAGGDPLVAFGDLRGKAAESGTTVASAS
jgi:hypothetical protein